MSDALLPPYNLRELGRGIHPAILGDQGLVRAVEARTAQLPITVAVESDHVRDTRFPEAIEGAAYFSVIEALTNVMKHSGVDSARIRLHLNEHGLNLEVADRGRGFDAASVHSTGIAGLSDRIEALGGTISITSRPGEGTVLAARLPINGANA